MDDQFAYLLSGLLTRHFGLGRIARFRQVQRSRQAATYEVLTAQQNEYLVYLFPASFPEDRLALMAATINRLDENRFSVMPFLRTKKEQGEAFVVPGPQNTRLLVGLNPAGSPQPAATWSEHQRSELGLRLAWMHRLLREESSAPAPCNLAAQLAAATTPDTAQVLAPLAAALGGLDASATLSPIHGDLHPDAVLLDADRQLRFILDWARLSPGNPVEDLAAVFIHWAGAQTAAMRPVLEAYFTLEPDARAALPAALPRYLARQFIESPTRLDALRPHLARLPDLTAALLSAAQ